MERGLGGAGRFVEQDKKAIAAPTYLSSIIQSNISRMGKGKRGKKRGQEGRNLYVSAQGDTTLDDIVGSSSQIGGSTDTVFSVKSRIDFEWKALREKMIHAAPFINESWAKGETHKYTEDLEADIERRRDDLQRRYRELEAACVRTQTNSRTLADKHIAFAEEKLGRVKGYLRDRIVSRVVLPDKYASRQSRTDRTRDVRESLEDMAASSEVLEVLDRHGMRDMDARQCDFRNSSSVFDAISLKQFALSARLPLHGQQPEEFNTLRSRLSMKEASPVIDTWLKAMDSYEVPSSGIKAINCTVRADEIGLFSRYLHLTVHALNHSPHELFTEMVTMIRDLSKDVNSEWESAERDLQQHAACLGSHSVAQESDVTRAVGVARSTLLLRQCASTLPKAADCLWQDVSDKIERELGRAHAELHRLASMPRDSRPSGGLLERRTLPRSRAEVHRLVQQRLQALELQTDTTAYAAQTKRIGQGRGDQQKRWVFSSTSRASSNGGSSARAERDWRDAVRQSRYAFDDFRDLSTDPLVTAIIDEMTMIRPSAPPPMPPLSNARGRTGGHSHSNHTNPSGHSAMSRHTSRRRRSNSEARDGPSSSRSMP